MESRARANQSLNPKISGRNYLTKLELMEDGFTGRLRNSIESANLLPGRLGFPQTYSHLLWKKIDRIERAYLNAYFFSLKSFKQVSATTGS
jgi:hypothetical protein